MSQSSTAPHSGAPYDLPGLLTYADQLDQSKTYRLSHFAGMWSLAELTIDTVAGGGLRIYAAAIPVPVLAVELGADLRTAELGATTTVTKVEG